MVTESLENRFNKGSLLLDRQVAQGIKILGAAWIQTVEDEKWVLYVVTPTPDDVPGLAMGEHISYTPKGIPIFKLIADVKHVRPDTAVGRALIDLTKRYPGPAPAHFQNLRLGDLSVLEAYIYPPITPPTPSEQTEKSRELVNKVVELMSQSAPAQPSQVWLQDGDSFFGVPFGLELSGGKMQVKFAVSGPEPPRVYPVEAIQAIE